MTGIGTGYPLPVNIGTGLSGTGTGLSGTGTGLSGTDTDFPPHPCTGTPQPVPVPPTVFAQKSVEFFISYSFFTH